MLLYPMYVLEMVIALLQITVSVCQIGLVPLALLQSALDLMLLSLQCAPIMVHVLVLIFAAAKQIGLA